MNWAIPRASAGLTALGFQPLSEYSCAASRAGLIAGHRVPHFCTRGWYLPGTAPFASPKARPPASAPTSPAAAEYVPTTSSTRKLRATPIPIPPAIQNLRTRQPSPTPPVFDGLFPSPAPMTRLTHP